MADEEIQEEVEETEDTTASGEEEVGQTPEANARFAAMRRETAAKDAELNLVQQRLADAERKMQEYVEIVAADPVASASLRGEPIPGVPGEVPKEITERPYETMADMQRKIAALEASLGKSTEMSARDMQQIRQQQATKYAGDYLERTFGFEAQASPRKFRAFLREVGDEVNQLGTRGQNMSEADSHRLFDEVAAEVLSLQKKSTSPKVSPPPSTTRRGSAPVSTSSGKPATKEERIAGLVAAMEQAGG